MRSCYWYLCVHAREQTNRRASECTLSSWWCELTIISRTSTDFGIFVCNQRKSGKNNGKNSSKWCWYHGIRKYTWGLGSTTHFGRWTTKKNDVTSAATPTTTGGLICGDWWRTYLAYVWCVSVPLWPLQILYFHINGNTCYCDQIFI